MKKAIDLQPWVDIFRMFAEYERKGYLEVKPEKHEAYVVRSAIHAMSEGSDPRQQLLRAIPDTAKRIRVFAGWRSQQGVSYLEKPFAVHVVKEQYPHDMIYTLLLTRRRMWWWPWSKRDSIEVIEYTEKD